MKLWKILIIFIVFVAIWITNLLKFLDCDFESNYKCEVVHGVGVFIPPVSVFTAWVKADKE
jgi:hypothetical protein